MTDRELLELAAKAAGVVGEYESWTYQGFNEGIRQVLNGIKCWKPWNPLTDDGDALRLAVKLQIDIRPSMSGSSNFRYAVYDGNTYGEVDSDPYAATRRAIVRAAAEIGRSMT